jgi:hypothetical protein
MKFFLAFTFLFLTPVPPEATNAIRVTSLYDKPLLFDGVNDCFKHARDNIDELHKLIGVIYPGSQGVVTRIICHPHKGINT